MSEIAEGTAVEQPRRKPDWLRVKLPNGENFKKVRAIVSEHKLHTICQSGNCPRQRLERRRHVAGQLQ